MKSKNKTSWFSGMGNQESSEMEKKVEKTEIDDQSTEKKSKKKSKEPIVSQPITSPIEAIEIRSSVKITFEGEAAQKILKCEAELKERLSKPDMGKIIGKEILTWSDKRWSELVEENTEIEYFFAQIRKCADKSKSIKLLKAVSEKLKNESAENSSGIPMGLSTAQNEEAQSDVG